MGKYTNNFHKGDGGNKLSQGEDLIISITEPDGMLSYVAGRLLKENRIGQLKVIQLEQTAHRGNPSKDSIKFEMVDGAGKPYPPGSYRVETRWHEGTGDEGIGDNFEIVA